MSQDSTENLSASKARHTPGEWTVVETPSGETVIRAIWFDEEGRRCTWWPAILNENKMHDHRANARLVAAAPEMLEALKQARELIHKWCFYQGNRQDLHDKYVPPIDAVIAKAERV